MTIKLFPGLSFACALACVLAFNSVEAANSFSRVALVHRDAADIQAAIAPLLSEGSGIVADNNSVVVSAPAAEIKSLVRAIKSLDKPRKQLQVSIFRGRFPDKKNTKTSTTQSGSNHSQHVRIEEGQALVISEQRVQTLTSQQSRFLSRFPSDSQSNNERGDNSALLVQSREGRLILDDLLNPLVENSSVLALPARGSGTRATGELFEQQQQTLISIPTGVHLRISLVGKKPQQARVRAKIVSPVDGGSAQGLEQGQSSLLSQSVESQASFALNQWFKLSELAEQSHSPVLGASRQVHSTGSAKRQQSLWLKVEALKR